jgi:hypothetical protein
MAQVSQMLYGTRASRGSSSVYRDWPGGLAALFLGTLTAYASLRAGRFVARQRALSYSSEPVTRDAGAAEAAASPRGSSPASTDEARAARQSGASGREASPAGRASTGARAQRSRENGSETQPAAAARASSAASTASARDGKHSTPGASSAAHAARAPACGGSARQLSIAVALCGALALWSLALGLCVHAYTQHKEYAAAVWLGCLLAPPFALLRWNLTALNEIPKRAQLP